MQTIDASCLLLSVFSSMTDIRVAVAVSAWQNEHHKLYVHNYTVVVWTVYFRQVVFKLHPSFAQPVRPVEGPSFELTETGWGEFDIQVEVRHTDSWAQGRARQGGLGWGLTSELSTAAA